MLKLLGLGFVKYLGIFVVVMTLLIILASLIGGITYDTSVTDRSWGGWSLTINFNFGQIVENIKQAISGRKFRLKNRIQERGSELDGKRAPHKERPRILPDRKRILPPRPSSELDIPSFQIIPQ